MKFFGKKDGAKAADKNKKKKKVRPSVKKSKELEVIKNINPRYKYL